MKIEVGTRVIGTEEAMEHRVGKSGVVVDYGFDYQGNFSVYWVEWDGDPVSHAAYDGEIKPIPTLTIEAGKYYRTRDGRKVGPARDCTGDFDIEQHADADLAKQVWKPDGTVWSEEGDESDHYLIAEWTEDDDMNEICDERKDGPFVKIDLVEIGTLAELNVKPGDVVECVDSGLYWWTIGEQYTVTEDGTPQDNNGMTYGKYDDPQPSITFRIISRASDTFKKDYSFMSSDVCLADGNDPYLFGDGGPVSASDTPKTWGEMTDAEKGAIALGFVQGKVVQCWQDGDTPEYWADIYEPNWNDDCKFRIKPEPKRETVTLYGVCGEFSDKFIEDHDTHRITFDTIDGKPATGEFRNDNGDVIKMEEV